ncbi:hypothetical protein GWA97_06930 [Flavobacterium sp. LaA7.5]|nr:hypothetical protein [Flavobacterium salilacus subsp. altitudinum]
MPISDQDGYEKGHFSRVYNHIIRPACEKAGFEPIRADDEVKTNYIALDIVKKIIESDLVLCDLSSKNPNVLYELGIRQAFNKKVVLIKDKKTGRIFDIQGFRTIDYDESLRIDEVEKSISSISSTLKETFGSEEGEINSFLQLLSIKPASLNDQIEISQESSIIMELLSNISEKMSRIEGNRNGKSLNLDNKNENFIINNIPFTIGETLTTMDGENIGELIDLDDKNVIIKRRNRIYKYSINDKIFDNLAPF